MTDTDLLLVKSVSPPAPVTRQKTTAPPKESKEAFIRSEVQATEVGPWQLGGVCLWKLWPPTRRLHAFWEWLFANGDMLLHPPCPRQPGGQTVPDRRGRPRPLKWCSSGEIIGEQRGHVWWKHTLQIYLGAAMSEQQQCRSQTLYLELSFLSLPFFSAEAWYAEAEQILPALIMTALRKFSTALADDIIQSVVKHMWSVLLSTQYKHNMFFIVFSLL